MSDSIAISLFSLAVSIAAAVASLVALWRGYLAKFAPLVTVGVLRQRVIPIRNEDSKWYIYLVDLPVAIANGGARPGTVLGMRLHLHFPGVPIPNNYERIYAVREVDPVKSNSTSKDFFAWLDDVQIADWMPFTVVPGATIRKHFHFQTRWDQPVVQKNCECGLQILTDSSPDWSQVARWDITLGMPVWSELLMHAITLGFDPLGAPPRDRDTYPKDLHKYISSNEQIPLGGFGTQPSYVDWPKDREEPTNDRPASA